MFWRREERRGAAAAESIANLIHEARGGGSPDPEPAPDVPVLNESGEALIRRRYRYVGQVQGVGFRWTSQRVAGTLGLTGWVRNEEDGSVTLVLQGTQEQLGAFATKLAENMARYARYTVADREDEPVDARETQFKVRY
ncbi:acylphosphatase [Paratractidigestivibacter sp.]|uniref:acylphosphatase n=1 Tax=Paratractidigestivibacter sp. TaxID=2847316 RepID=UPI002ABDEAC0|nr:acylphosphatase [Paratractidigestivibacter sp.]